MSAEVSLTFVLIYKLHTQQCFLNRLRLLQTGSSKIKFVPEIKVDISWKMWTVLSNLVCGHLLSFLMTVNRFGQTLTQKKV